MRNLFSSKYMYLTAAMLTGAAMFTSCSNEDDMGNVNPTYDGESVKTQFAINIPAAGKADTRLSQDIVQGQDPATFRGMTNIRLIPLNSANAVTTSTAFTNDAIMLEAIPSLSNNAKFYNDVSIPVGTNRFLFYGEATAGTGATDATNGKLIEVNDFTIGNLLNGNCTTVGDIAFELKQINKDQNTEIQGYLTTILNSIVTAFGTPTGNETMLTALENLKSLKVGSSAAILAIMQDLYDLVKNGSSNSVEETVKNAILGYFSETTGTLIYKTTGTTTGYVTNANNYPKCLNIPNGAAQIAWNVSTNTFEYKKENATDYATYVHPAALYYYIESKLKSDDDVHSTEWTTGTASTTDWNNFITQNYSDESVKSTTESIVLTEPIRYAVAQFVYNVKFASNIVNDSKGVGRYVDNNFELNGILIGGQKKVDYQFAQTTVASEPSRTIYDYTLGATNAVYVTTSATSDMYSLALQSELRTTNDANGQKTVSFALELINHGEDFYGKDGEIIPSGGTFYLTGSMSTIESNNERNSVFEKAYKTTANITISSLKEAQYTIPDLRTTQLELGLYVDLTWENGLSFDVEIGGN